MFFVPTIPNSPLISPDARDPMGPMELRRNPALDFIENAAFDSSIAEYDDEHQPRFDPNFELNPASQAIGAGACVAWEGVRGRP